MKRAWRRITRNFEGAWWAKPAVVALGSLLFFAGLVALIERTPAVWSPGMDATLTDFEAVTPEKVELIAQQANRLHDFVLASREILTREAHATLQWLFAVIVGAAGYVVTLLKVQSPPVPIQWWLVDTLLLAVALAGITAIQLFWFALRVKPVAPPGNLPRHLARDEQMAYPAHLIRLQETLALQDPIIHALNGNQTMGRSIMVSRWVVLVVPTAAALFLAYYRFTLS